MTDSSLPLQGDTPALCRCGHVEAAHFVTSTIVLCQGGDGSCECPSFAPLLQADDSPATGKPDLHVPIRRTFDGGGKLHRGTGSPYDPVQCYCAECDALRAQVTVPALSVQEAPTQDDYSLDELAVIQAQADEWIASELPHATIQKKCAIRLLAMARQVPALRSSLSQAEQTIAALRLDSEISLEVERLRRVALEQSAESFAARMTEKVQQIAARDAEIERLKGEKP